MDVEFVMGMSYHPPLGFQKKGHHEPYWVSKCHRWHVRPGNFGTMILTDKDRDNCVHVVKGKMPGVYKKVEEILSAHPREYSYEN